MSSSVKVGQLTRYFHEGPPQAPAASPAVPSIFELDGGLEDAVQALKETLNGLPLAPQVPGIGFLTGVTGFVGTSLFHALLTKTQLKVAVLVRARDDPEAKRRILEALGRAGISWEEEWNSRTAILRGDLAEPQLGIAADSYQLLSREADVIYHAAAEVNWVLPYGKLRRSNVIGTLELVKLACTGKRKALFHVSTGGLGSSESSVDPSRLSGYARTKLVAERLVQAAVDIGLYAQIYRPGLITGHTVSGHSNPSDYENLYMKGCIALGAYIADDEATLDMTPVDFVSDAIVALSQHCDTIKAGSCIPLASPGLTRYSLLGEGLVAFGYRLSPLPYTQWQGLLREHVAGNPLEALLSRFPPDRIPQATLQSPAPELAVVSPSPRCPLITAGVVSTYLKYLADSGFIERPKGHDHHPKQRENGK